MRLPMLAALWVSAVAAAPVRESFDIVVPLAPAPVTVEGRQTLIYELHLTNFAREPLELHAIRVIDADRNAMLARFDGAALKARVRLLGADAMPSAIPPGGRAIVYIDLVDAPRGLHALRHEIDAGAGLTVRGGGVMLGRAPVRIGAPLRGGPWVAIHQADWPRGHRRVIYTVDGRARIPGRYAIDWVQTDERGATAKGDADRAAETLGYAAEVIAVADAPVVAIRDDMAEPERISQRKQHAIGDAAGNYVILKLAPDRFAIYEHLKPGSVRVKPGDRVKRGQVIAALGFTGDSTGPHLHFHVGDAPSPLGGEGVPYVIDRFTLLGRYADLGTLGSARWQPAAIGAARTGERPGSNTVIRFAD